MDDMNGARAAGQRAALTTSGLGLLVALAVTAGFGLARYLRGANGWLVLGATVVGVLGFAWAAGGAVAVAIKRGGNPWLLGVTLALTTILVPTVVISLGAWAVQQLPIGVGHALGELGSYVLKPLFLIGSAGAIPAAALGLLYAHLVRRSVP